MRGKEKVEILGATEKKIKGNEIKQIDKGYWMSSGANEKKEQPKEWALLWHQIG